MNSVIPSETCAQFLSGPIRQSPPSMHHLDRPPALEMTSASRILSLQSPLRLGYLPESVKPEAIDCPPHFRTTVSVRLHNNPWFSYPHDCSTVSGHQLLRKHSPDRHKKKLRPRRFQPAARRPCQELAVGM